MFLKSLLIYESHQFQGKFRKYLRIPFTMIKYIELAYVIMRPTLFVRNKRKDYSEVNRKCVSENVYQFSNNEFP